MAETDPPWTADDDGPSSFSSSTTAVVVEGSFPSVVEETGDLPPPLTDKAYIDHSVDTATTTETNYSPNNDVEASWVKQSVEHGAHVVEDLVMAAVNEDSQMIATNTSTSMELEEETGASLHCGKRTHDQQQQEPTTVTDVAVPPPPLQEAETTSNILTAETLVEEPVTKKPKLDSPATETTSALYAGSSSSASKAAAAAAKKVNNEQWDAMFERLVAYKAANGDCLVPKRYSLDPKLGTWVETQRVQYKRLQREVDQVSGVEAVQPNKRLNQERLNKLESIGFAWTAKGTRKTKQVVPPTSTTPLSVSVPPAPPPASPAPVTAAAASAPAAGQEAASVVATGAVAGARDSVAPATVATGERQGQGRKTVERQSSKVGSTKSKKSANEEGKGEGASARFYNRLNDSQWEEMYQRLVQYKEKYGDTLVPRKYDQDPRLATWVETQRVLWNRDYREAETKTSNPSAAGTKPAPGMEADSMAVEGGETNNEEWEMATEERRSSEMPDGSKAESQAELDPGGVTMEDAVAIANSMAEDGTVQLSTEDAMVVEPQVSNTASLPPAIDKCAEGTSCTLVREEDSLAVGAGVASRIPEGSEKCDGNSSMSCLPQESATSMAGTAAAIGVSEESSKAHFASIADETMHVIDGDAKMPAQTVGAEGTTDSVSEFLKDPVGAGGTTDAASEFLKDSLQQTDSTGMVEPSMLTQDGSKFPQLQPKRLTLERKQKLDALGFVWSLRNKRIDDHWDEMFRQLLEYREKHGDCLVPSRYEENLKLGKWVETQRYEYTKLQRISSDSEGGKSENEFVIPMSNGKPRATNPRLTEERLRRLESIGFEWKVKHKMKRYYDKQWDIMFDRLLKFKEANGHCIVPKRYPPDLKLGTWVHTQRIQYRKMMSGNKNPGDTTIDWGPEDSEAVKSMEEEVSYRLTDDRKKRLEEIGFVWSARESEKAEPGRLNRNSYDDQWDAMFNRLKAYKEMTGDCLVPKRYKEDPKLGTWVDTQRVQYKKMKKKIASMGGDFQGPWPTISEEEMELEAATTGSAKPIVGRLTDERIRRLEDLGFVWSLRDDWQKHYDELKEFKREHGHCQVPARYTKNRRLGIWVSAQRQQYKLMQGMEDPKQRRAAPLTQDRIDLLNQIGFTWTIRSRDSLGESWNQRLQDLRDFKREHGHCLVPSRYPPCPELGVWVGTQRTQYRLYMKAKEEGSLSAGTSAMNDERIKQLEEMGFVWTLRGPDGKKEVDPADVAAIEQEALQVADELTAGPPSGVGDDVQEVQDEVLASFEMERV